MCFSRRPIGDDRLEGVIGSQPAMHWLVRQRRDRIIAATEPFLDVLALVGVSVSGDHRLRHDFVDRAKWGTADIRQPALPLHIMCIYFMYFPRKQVRHI